ncbi:hypothetical protein [Wenzhouxiangella marina]|uniref:Uncharacterized protein n=1 Tax=Wenzhouxiangella marina TaxID=1579979 RepID=A0A0K0XVK4_9GAMM|nr:hypothetical protein [Wenzhouxiangella marina]AKS41667.1 hypothetical protein WM2015_1294 [Wenzhouxiangella marina]MBB6086572.1 hypothetical protein [Wenzhouxiangella marina]
MKRFMTLSIVAMIVLAVTLFHGWKTRDWQLSDPRGGARAPLAEASGADEAHPADSGSFGEPAGKRDDLPEPATRTPEPGRPALSSAPTATQFLRDAAKHFGWTERQFRENVILWSAPCQQARSMSRVPGEQLASLGLNSEFANGTLRLAQFCGNVDLEASLATLDALEQSLSDDWNPEDERSQLASEVDEFGVSEALVDGSIRLLRSSLDRLDEGGVANLLGVIADRGLIDSERLSAPEFRFIAPHIISDVALTLICSETDGCVGEYHPIVIRYCLQKFQFGQLCNSPTSLADAIRQTTSPIHYDWYLVFHNYLRSRLSRLGR